MSFENGSSLKTSKAEPRVSSPPLKKQKLESSCNKTDVVIYIVEKKISSGHLSHLRGVAKKKGFTVTPSLSENVTHIVTTLTSYERLKSVLSCDLPTNAEVISLEWLTASFVEGRPVQVTDRYRLHKTLPTTAPDIPATSTRESEPSFQIPEYECQRATLLEHHNHLLTDALELLERYYQHLDHKQGDTRALAFRQASCALKVLPKKVEDIKEVVNMHRIGKHSSQVIEDILTTGSSHEVEECKKSEWFQCMELFTTVYGCGSATADKWYQKGLRSIKDVQACKELHLTETQRLGLAYYDHISSPVSREETELIVSYIQRQLDVCMPGTSVEAVGGYRRGKPHGHDVDLLLTHPDNTAADRLLDTLLTQLHKQGVLVHSDVNSGHNTVTSHASSSLYHTSQTGRPRRVKFDNLDKAFCILSLPQADELASEDIAPDDHTPIKQPNKESQSRLIKRVDFIVSPPEQYPFALVSWTGSKQFNRSLRRYSAKELNMSVTAHGIYDIGQGKFLPAAYEREVFAVLKLEYREPWERNC